jgi:glycosyltransferase involved in cell wall biosynthesis
MSISPHVTGGAAGHLRQPTLLIISQVYVPDPAAVGQHIADVAEEMVRRGFRVVVYTAARGYDDPSVRYPRRERRNGVDVRRLPLSSFGKTSIAVRLLAQTLFIIQATLCGLFTRRLARVLVSTSPPFAGAAGALIGWLRRAPMVWWVMDLNPDQLVAAGKIAPRAVIVRVFDWLNRLTLRRAAAVVVLDRFMEERVLRKGAGEGKIHVVPPWAHEGHLESPPGTNPFRIRHGLLGKFVVMYSGNHSLQNPLDTLLEAATALGDDNRIRFLFVGGGVGKAAVDALIQSGATNIISLPYQTIETLGESLSAADIHVVSVGENMVGIVHPCKIYGALAIGRPVLLLGPDPCHAGDILKAGDIGWHVRHGDVAGARKAIADAASMKSHLLATMGAEAASLSQRHFSRAALLCRLCDLIAADQSSSAKSVR